MPGNHENVVFEMGRHAAQTMLHDALVRGSRAHGLLYGDARVIERTVPLCDETVDEDADRRPPMAVYAASDETLEQIRARMGGGLPGVIVRLDTKGRLEAVMRDARGRERSLDLREDGAAPVRAAGLYPMRHKE